MSSLYQTELEIAIAEYAAASKEGKALLEKCFGKERLMPNIMDRVKTFEDACKVLNLNYSYCVNGVEDSISKSLVAFYKLQIIAKALNEGWVPDWSNSDQYKYYPWFKYGSGVGFSYADAVFDHTYTGVGSRLCFKTRELAEYAGKHFQGLYNDFLLLNQ